jgi:hypothetical protein
MDERPIKTLLDLLPEYINFAICFLRSPRRAFAPYELKGRVHADMTSFLFAGVGAAYLAVLLIPIAGLDIQEPHGAMDRFAAWLTRQDVKLLPLEALMAVLVAALGAHFFAKLFDYLGLISARVAKDKAPVPNFPGTTEDSVNAALGFAAVMLPLTIAFFLGVLSLATLGTEKRDSQAIFIAIVAGALVVFTLLAIFYYLVMSFAATHKVGYWRAASALATAYVCIAVLVTNIP